MKYILLSAFMCLYTFEKAQVSTQYNFAGEQSVFTENKGQVVDMNGQPVPGVLAKASMPGLDMYVTQTGVTYVMLQYTEDLTAPKHPVFINDKKFKVTYSRVDVALTGATLTSQQLQLTGNAGWQSNYYKTSDAKGQLAVSHFKNLTVQNVYPGIDWAWKFNAKGNLEYEFIVHPGADPSVIKMQYSYADLKTAKYKLAISTRIGSMTEGPLQATDAGNKVNINYNLDAANKAISFVPATYDKTKDLVIDPPLALNWSAQFGGSFLNGLRGVTTDTSGGVFMVGYTTSSDFPLFNPHGGAYIDSTFNGQADIIVLKLDTNQHIKWATFVGGPGNDYGNSICFSKITNRVYITGSGESGLPLSIYNPTNHGGSDAYIASFNSALIMYDGTYLGGSNTDEALAIYAADSTVYVAGYTNSTDFNNQGFGYGQNPAGGFDAFIASFGFNSLSQLSLSWITHFGGSGNDYATCIASDSAHIVMGGYTTSTNLPLVQTTNGYYQANNAGGTDGFIAQFDKQHVLVNSTYYGGSGNDYIFGAAPGLGQSFDFTGSTSSSNLPLVNIGGYGYFQSQLADSIDAFILKCNDSLTVQWATYLGGNATDEGTGISTDVAGNMYVTGFTFSTNFPVQNQHNAFYQPTNHGNSDGFVAQFSNLGVRNWCTYKGDSCYQYPNNIYFDNRFNKFYVAGEGLLACLGDTQGVSLPDTGQVHNGVSSIGFCWAFNGLDACAGFGGSVNISQQPCPGQCNGIANIIVTGGTLPYSYKWASGDTFAIDNNFCYNDIWAEIKDSLGCIASVYPQLAPIHANPTSIGVTCFGAQTIILGNVYGGNGNPANYIYQWSTSPGVQSDSAYISVTDTGIYNITVTDSTLCSATATVRVGFNNIAPHGVIEFVKYPACLGSVAEINFDSPATDIYYPNGSVTWFEDFSPIATGPWISYIFNSTYNYIVDSAYCYNGITAPVTYGYIIDTYEGNHNQWFVPPSSCISNDGKGDVGFAPNLNCTITQQQGNTTYHVVNTEIIDTTDLNYYWSDGEHGPNAYHLTAGLNIVTITDDLCEWFDSINVSLPSPQVTPVVDSVHCSNNDGVINLSYITDANGGPYTYYWQNGSSMSYLNSLASGDYLVTVTDGYGCSSSLDINVPLISNNIPPEVDSVIILQYPSCGMSDGIVYIKAPDPSKITWTLPGGHTVKGDTLYNAPISVGWGLDFITIIDSTSCIYGNQNIVEYQLMMLPFIENGLVADAGEFAIFQNPYGCNTLDGFIENNLSNWGDYYVTVNGSYFGENAYTPVIHPSPVIYKWSTGEIDTISTPILNGYNQYGNGPVNLGAGTYTVTVTNGTCSAQDTVVLVPTAPALVADYSVTNPTCNLLNTGQIILTGYSNNYSNIYGDSTNTFVWSNGATTGSLSNLRTGIYTVTITGPNACPVIDTFVITQPTPLIVTDTVTSNAQCYGSTGVVHITATGGTSPYYNTGNITAHAGNNLIVVTDQNGCADSVYAVITQPPPLIVTDTVTTNAQCYGSTGIVHITAMGGTQPYYNTGNVAVQAGNNLIVVTDQNGCADTISATITQPTSVNVAIQWLDTITHCKDTAKVLVTATGGNGPYTGTGTVTYTHNGVYTISVTDANGCATDTTLNLHFDTCTSVEDVATDFAVNIYPNPAADKFYVHFTSQLTQPADVRLYAADGKLIIFKTIGAGGEQCQIDCNLLASGVYILRTVVRQQQYNFKVVITR